MGKRFLTTIKSYVCLKPLFIVNLLTFVLVGCSTLTSTPYSAPAVTSPDHWQASLSTENYLIPAEPVLTDWLAGFNDPQLVDLVAHALTHNHALKAQSFNIAMAAQQIIQSEATDLPELSLALNNSRRNTVNDVGNTLQSSASIALQLDYELDLWGKLSAEQQQAQLTWSAQTALYHSQQQTLAADVVSAWFNLTQAKQLLTLYQQRAGNLQHNLALIQSSYQLGLKAALDVYLAKNDVNRELARVTEQQQLVQEQSRQFELLLGDYPNGAVLPLQGLPKIDTDIAVGVPSQLLARRPDIQANWYQLLAQNAALAIAHKQRFPRLMLSANGGDSGEHLGDLLNGSALAWSLIGNLAAPLFNAGKLAANEEQARLTVLQREQTYLSSINQAFREVENGIGNALALNKRYDYLLEAQNNALAAQDLSFEQYLKGLVNYTTVLESQRRAVDAQTALIQLSNQLLQNRITLYVALGGDLIEPSDRGVVNQPSQIVDNS